MKKLLYVGLGLIIGLSIMQLVWLCGATMTHEDATMAHEDAALDYEIELSQEEIDEIKLDIIKKTLY